MALSPLETLRAAWILQPKGRAFFQLGEALWRDGSVPEAIEVLEKGLVQNPGIAAARLLLAELLVKTGADGKALPHLVRQFDMDQENLKINRLLAEIYYRAGQREPALKHFKIVQIFDPDDKLAQQRLLELSEPPQRQSGVQDEAEDLAAGSEAVTHPGASPSATQRAMEPATLETLPVEEPELEMPLTAPELAEANAPFAAPSMESSSPLSDALPELDLPGLADEPGTPPEDLTDSLSEFAPDAAPGAGIARAPMPASFSSPAAGHRPLAAAHPDEENEPAEEITTETLAEIYLSQGHVQKAIRIYERLLLTNPMDTRIRSRIEGLQRGDNVSVVPDQPALRLPSRARQRKIESLQTWLSTIQKERNA